MLGHEMIVWPAASAISGSRDHDHDHDHEHHDQDDDEEDAISSSCVPYEKQTSERGHRGKAPRGIRSCRIITSCVALLLLMVVSSNVTTTTETATLPELGADRTATRRCFDETAGSAQRNDDGEARNQLVYQSDHLSAAVVIGQEPAAVVPSLGAPIGGGSSPQPKEQTSTTTTIELYPSRSQQITAIGSDRWWAFHKCNSCREDRGLDKQSIGATRADELLARRLHSLDVGHRGRLARSSGMFAGRHQTSLRVSPASSSASAASAETSFLSWPRGKRRQSSPSPSSIGRKVKRKRPALEEKSLIGSSSGQSQQATAVASGPAKVVGAEQRSGAEEDDEEEDEDEDEDSLMAADAEVDNLAETAAKQSAAAAAQLGHDNRSRHFHLASGSQATAAVATATDSRVLTGDFLGATSGEPTRAKISADHQIGGSRQLDAARNSPDEEDYRPNHLDGQRRQQHSDRAARSEDDGVDPIISHYNLTELMDDDLFLAEGASPPQHSIHDLVHPSRRSSRWAGGSTGLPAESPPSSSVFPDKTRTIYFGGFFPWLADEDTRFTDGGDTSGQHEQLAAGRNSPSGAANDDADAAADADSDSYRDERAEWTRTRLGEKNQQQQRRKKHYKTGDEPASFGSSVVSTEPATPRQVLAAAAAAAYQGSASSSSAENSNINNRHQLGRFILPAVRLALDHINTNSSILGTYKLEIVPRDTQCNATISLKEFFDMVYEEPKKMLLYGDACRVSTDPIAKASYFFDLIQISYADTDPIYTIENYPNFFRVVPSENALSLARIPFIRHFNWTRVGTIYQNLPRYSLPHSKLLTDLERFKIVIKQSVSLPGSIDGLQNRDLGDELRKLKEKDVRIILGNFDEEWALLLFCEAYREKMTGRKYQWILTGVSEDKLWQHYLKKGSECSEQELLIAMDGYIITDITPVTRSQHPTISGMMAHEYSNEYRRRAREMNIAIEENKFYGYVYDGIWAIALALHRVDSQLRYYNRLLETGKTKLNPELQGITSLLDFDYHKQIWVKLIRNALNKTRFNGVTGTVSFHKNERPGLISFSQFQAFRDMNEVIIGSYDALNDELDLKVGFPIFWRGSSPPIDYTIERVTPFRINRTLFVIISILALFGIVLATVFLTINIKFRNQRYIKMSSPYLNNLIIIGCILTYTSVIILGLDSGLTSEFNFPYICNARAWVLMAGFTLAFGSMFSKTFRYFDPFYRETNNGTSIQDPDNEDIIIVPEMEHCQSKRMTIFLSVIYVYKGLLMAFGCFLAWETRHVSIPALNDSKYIGLSVYNVVIMCVIGAGLSFVLRDQQDASFVIISIFIIFCSTTTLCLVFVPKLIELKQNPRAGDHRVRATLKTFKKNYHEEAFGAAGCRDFRGNIIGRGGYGINLNERIKIVIEENTKQRSSLKEKTYELEALTYKYRKIQGMIQSGQYLQALSSSTANGAGSINPKQQAAGQTMICSSTEILTTSKSPTTLLTANINQSTSSVVSSRALPEVVAHEKPRPSPFIPFPDAKQAVPSCKTGEEIRASCPDIAASQRSAASHRSAGQSFAANYRRQVSSISTTAADVDAAADVNSNKTRLASRGRLPRTISMIEYLGLSELDFVARRHDKLIKGKLESATAKRKQLDYCCSDHCPCCNQNYGTMVDNRCSTQSEADMVFSSSEIANSGAELAQFGSHLSCSTCCSLMSPSYVSHSDYMLDEVSRSSGSASTGQSLSQSSSSSNDTGSLSLINCHSQSKSSIPSSTYENKERTILNAVGTCSVCREPRPDNHQPATPTTNCNHQKRQQIAQHAHHEHTQLKCDILETL